MVAPTVSVLMGVYNGEAFLAEAIESILHQTMKDFEFVIVDDGSTDGTGEILRRYAAADARVRVVTRGHEGLIASLNFGRGIAQGKYIARMDADDVAFPDRLAKQIAFLDAHPNVAVVGGAIQMINDRGVVLETIALPQSDDAIKELLLRENAMAHVTAVIRRDVLNAVGGYRRAFAQAEDYDLWLRVADQHELANLPDVLMHCRTRPDSVSVRFRKQQVLSKLGAQLSAQARRATGRDPMAGADLVTSEGIRALGIDEGRVSEMLLEHYARTANHLARAGHSAEALAFLGRALEEGRAEGADNSFTAGLLLERAEMASRDRKYGALLRSVLVACLLAPVASKRVFRRVWRRIRAS